jgi:heat shock protein HtpX
MKTGLLMLVLTLLLVGLGHVIGGPQLANRFFLISLAMNLVMFFFSDKLVLAMYRAQPVDESQAPELYAMVRELTQRAQLPMPRVYVIDSPQPNAFATGRSPSKAVVAVTTGIMGALSRDELRGVIAHELAHIRNRDMLTMTVAAALAGAISHLAWMGMWMGGGRSDERNPLAGILAIVGVIVVPIAAALIQMAISRSREYAADAGGAQISGSPLSLASALEKLEALSHRVPMAHAQPATAHLFIVNPLSAGGVANLFSTHPPMRERIARLRAMVG